MKIIKNVLLALVLATTVTSCNNDDDNNNQDDTVQRFDRNISFKVIGEYSGRLYIAYANPISPNNVTPSEVLTTTPWQKDLDYSREVALTGAYITGESGQINEIVQLQVFSNGELIDTEYAIADRRGRIYAETSTIYFK